MAGAIIGEHGLNLLERDSGIVMSGTAGILYIMFLAGLEIDINEFVKSRWKSIIFGLFTFAIPMALGTLTGLYLLHFSLMTSILLASMFASHTLLAYPIISKLGVKRNRAVTVAIGGTVIAETLALLVLAIIVGMTEGEVNSTFWITMSVKLLLFGATIFILFPIIARYVLSRCSDGMTQYIFILFMLFLGSVLAQVAGVEGIIGALFTGLALNRLIPNASALMNRVEFVGNAIFIPFFLIGVGMLIDYRVLSDPTTLYVAFVMTVVAIITKYLAAWFTQKSFGYSNDERTVIFGLSSARAAATLAVVLVGYNVILGHDGDGEPIRLLNSSVLNGTIVMIFITCSVASISAQKGASRLSMSEDIDIDAEQEVPPMILLPLNSTVDVEQVVSMTNLMMRCDTTLTVASIVSDSRDETEQLRQSKKIFEKALHSASSLDRPIETIMRYDTSYTNGISNLIRENNVSDMVISVPAEKELSESIIKRITDGSMRNSSVTTFVYRSVHPVENIRRYHIIVPDNAEMEMGFKAWVVRLWGFLRATGATASIYATKSTLQLIEQINHAVPLPMQVNEYMSYRDLEVINKDLRKDDGLVFVLSHRMTPSHYENMDRIPHYINTYFNSNNFIIIYPYKSGVSGGIEGMTNISSMGTFGHLESLLDGVVNLIKKIS